MTSNNDSAKRYLVGDLVVDAATHSVTRGGREVGLTRASFALFEALIRHAPRILTHDELLADDQGKVIVSDEALKQRIKVLRQALDDGSETPRYIASVRGVGYRLIAAVTVLPADQPQPKPELESAKAPWRASPSARKSLLAGAVITAGAAIVLLLTWQRGVDVSRPPESAAAGQRLAVLPFRNLSGDPANAYFAAGVTEDLITQLSKIGELRVISGTTTARYRDSDKSLKEIAAELDVAVLLEGSVRRDGDRVRITGQLIEAATDSHLWAETYDEKFEDIFAIQQDVATRIAHALEVELADTEAASLAKRPTQSTKAYEYLLRGRDAYARYRRLDNEMAIEFYAKALEIDPGYALAKAELANAYGLRAAEYDWATDAGFDAAAIASRLAQEALAIDPELPEAHKALGLALGGLGRLREARDAHARAAKLRPNYTAAVHNVGELSFILGEWDEAMRWAQRAVERDYPSIQTPELYAQCLLNLGFTAEADRWFSYIAEQEPLRVAVHMYRARRAERGGSLKEARTHLQRMLRAEPRCIRCLEFAAVLELRAGNDEEAARLFGEANVTMNGSNHYALLHLARILRAKAQAHRDEADLTRANDYSDKAARSALAGIERGSDHPLFRWHLAGIEAVRGNRDSSLAWFKRAVDAGRRNYEWDLTEPAFETVRDDPRFQAQIDRMRGSVKTMRQRAESHGWHRTRPPAVTVAPSTG